MECSLNARLLFIGLWNFADDCGRHPASPKQIKASIFPSDDLPLNDIQRMLDELSKNNLITTYVVEGKGYLTIDGWHHQRIDKPQPAKYPDPAKADSTNVLGTFPPDTKGNDTKGNDIAAGAAGGKDLLWEAMLAGCGINLKAEHTKSERGAWNKALQDLKTVNATPDEVLKRCIVYKQKWPGITITPNGLVKHWSECAPVVTELRPRKMLGDE